MTRRPAYALVIALCSACRREPTSTPVAEAPFEPTPSEPAPREPIAKGTVPVATETSPTIEPPGADSSRDIRAPSAPQSPDSSTRAHEHFRSGAIAFDRGEFAKAVAEFIAADNLVPKAAILFNVANAREKMGDVGGARNTYTAVLARPDLDENLRNIVVEHIARIDRILGGGPQSP